VSETGSAIRALIKQKKMLLSDFLKPENENENESPIAGFIFWNPTRAGLAHSTKGLAIPSFNSSTCSQLAALPTHPRPQFLTALS
jgi:hypothetical protein